MANPRYMRPVNRVVVDVDGGTITADLPALGPAPAIAETVALSWVDGGLHRMDEG